MCKIGLVVTVMIFIGLLFIGTYFIWKAIIGDDICRRGTSPPPIYKCRTTVTIFGVNECSFKNICLDARHAKFIPESDDSPENKTTTIDLGGGSGSRMQTLTADICAKFPTVINYRASFLGLTKINENAFNECKKLEKLNLGYNYLEYLDPTIFIENFEIKYLYLYYNRLREIDPGIFRNLLKLEKLHLEGNFLVSFQMKALPVFVNLKSLFLNRNELKNLEIKRFYKKFPKLRYLSVCDNFLSDRLDVKILIEYFSEKFIQTDLNFCLNEMEKN
uniref:CSON014039 protein n=1 Tax=Culicoides sonorensis TaxID=179676 RepID=A0A336MDI2_CULSO